MGRNAKGEPLTQSEMIEVCKQKRASSKIYLAESKEITNEAISASIHNALTEMKRAEGRKKISLEDTETVKKIAEDYLESCAVASCFPSMSGLAMAMGYTRNNLYDYMKKKGDSATGQFLTQLHDIFSNILAENSLRNNANSITSIFLLKALFGYKDTQTFELVNGSTDFDPLSTHEITERANLLDD